MNPVAHPRSAALVIMACGWLSVAGVAQAQTLPVVADTYIHLKTLAQQDKPHGNKTTLAIKTDHPRGANDRLAVLRFDVPAGATASHATLRLVRANPQVDFADKVLQLYAVGPNAAELGFDENTYAAGQPDSAVDKSGNRIRETQMHDPDTSTQPIEPLAKATASTSAPRVDFQGPALDAYLNGRAGQSAAFVVAATLPEDEGSTSSAFFHSRQARGEATLRPSLTLNGTPASAAPSEEAEPHADHPKGAIIGTQVDFEPRPEVELLNNQVFGNGTARYHFYYQDGRQFNLPAYGDAADPEISTEQARSGTHSLKIHAGPSGDRVNRDRLEFRLKQGSNDEHPFRFGQDRWYGVSMFIHPDSDIPISKHWVHVGQLWQPSTVGPLAREKNWGIPMAMSFMPGQDGFVLKTVCKSDGRRSEFKIAKLETGKWHDLAFNVLLSHSKDDYDGHLRIWVNGELAVDETVDIGNYPRTAEEDGFFALDAMDIRFGMYRKNQKLSQTLYLDDLWFSDQPRDPGLTTAGLEP